MDINQLSERIEQSARLRKLRAKLTDEIQFRVDTASQFDPMLVIMLISIIVQVVIHCREKRSTDDVIQDIRDIRALPPRRLVRLRRRLNALWHSNEERFQVSSGDVNPLLTAVYEIGETSDTETLKELVELADE
jgi:hypothetical protein